MAWHRKDEEKLLEAINGGNSIHFASSISLCGKFDVTSCEKKLIEMENKVWNMEDDKKVWKLQSLFETHASQVSTQLRRPVHCIRRHLTEMKQNRFKPLNSVVKKSMVKRTSNDEKEKQPFKKFMSYEDEEYNKFYKNAFTDFVDPIAYKDFKTEGEIEFRTILFIPGMEDVIKSKVKNVRFYVKRVLAFDGDLFPTYLSFVKAVVDSDSPLNVSRETLKGSRIERIMRERLIGKTFDLIDEISEREEKRDYKTFWENYGRFLKMGCIEDTDHQKRITPLLRFYSSKSKKELTSLDTYVDNMGRNQDGIYFATDRTLKSDESSSFLERVPDDIEVLFLAEPIDEILIEKLQSYRKVMFVDIRKERSVLGDEDYVKERKAKDGTSLKKKKLQRRKL